MLKGNKGEWSEPYVFLKLLGDGRIYAADENLKKIDTMYYPVLKVIGEIIDEKQCEYRVSDEAKHRKIVIFFNDKKVREVEASEFSKEAARLYNEIQAAKEGTFSIAKTQDFLNSVYRFRMKMGSRQKADITVKIHDIETGYEPEVGFSIKSELGHPPTLSNASKATNFIYEVTGLSQVDMELVNEMGGKQKLVDRMAYIKAHAHKIQFIKTSSPVYAENLMLVDSLMPEILAEMVKEFYFQGTKESPAILTAVAARNPLGVPGGMNFYAYKYKKFLCAVALGMLPASRWDGHEEANGGYIIVSETGDVLAYHIYNREFFETYLLNNTCFEKPSSSRNNFGSLYMEDGHMYLNLNLQIRFSC